jgi:hypothetical protein
MATKLTKSQIIFTYTLNRNPQLPSYAPVPGFYHVASLLDVTVTNCVQSFMVQAYWHPDEADFDNSVPLKVQLCYLFNKHSTGLKEIAPADLLNSVIHILSTEPVIFEYDGEKKSSCKTEWEIIDFIEPTTTSREFVAAVLGDEDKSNTISAQIALTEIEEEFPNEDNENELMQLLYDQQLEDEITRLLNAELNQLLYDEQFGYVVDAESEHLAKMSEHDLNDDLTDLD